MKSTTRSNSPHRRLFFLLGSGPGAACSLEFLTLFVKAGFSVYPAVHPSGESWVGSEALRTVCEHTPMAFHQVPSWAEHVDSFELAIGIGLSPIQARELIEGGLTTPFHETWRKSRAQAFLFAPSASVPPETWLQLPNLCGLVYQLPGQIGAVHEALRSVFADVVAFLRRRSLVRKLRVALRRTIPEDLRSLAGEPPAWYFEFKRHLLLAGFSLTNPGDEAADLAIETYDGPGTKTAARKKSVELDFSPESWPPLQAGQLTLRFVSSNLPAEELLPLANGKQLLAVRKNTGDLLIYSQHPPRLIPHLSEKSAFARLTDLLLNSAAGFGSGNEGTKTQGLPEEER